MSGMPWARLYTDVLDDVKLARLSDRSHLRFYQLIALASECDQRGRLVNGDSPLSSSDMAWRLRIDDEIMITDLTELRDQGLVTFDDDTNTWSVTSFAKRQPRTQEEKRSQWRERQDRHREKEEDVTHDSVSIEGDSHASVTRDTDMLSRVSHVDRLDKSRLDKSREEDIASACADNDKGKLPELINPFSQFSTAFTNKTRIPELTGGAPRWVKAINELINTGATIEDMVKAIEELPDHYKITGPWSVINPTVLVMSKRLGNNGRKKKDWQLKDPDLDYLRLNPRGGSRQEAIGRLKQKGMSFQQIEVFLTPEEKQAIIQEVGN